MIHDIMNALTASVTAEFPEVKECRYYKGEFEEGSEWNPVFPVVFINCSSLLPDVESQDGWRQARETFNVFVGIRMEQADQQTFLANFIRFITSLRIDGCIVEASAITLAGYFSGIEAYKIELNVIEEM
jgi:hypothetical protein